MWFESGEVDSLFAPRSPPPRAHKAESVFILQKFLETRGVSRCKGEKTVSCASFLVCESGSCIVGDGAVACCGWRNADRTGQRCAGHSDHAQFWVVRHGYSRHGPGICSARASCDFQADACVLRLRNRRSWKFRGGAASFDRAGTSLRNHYDQLESGALQV
jgi:hypothetical protein